MLDHVTDVDINLDTYNLYTQHKHTHTHTHTHTQANGRPR